MAGQLTIAEMKALIDRLESAKTDDVGIPQNYIERLEKADRLLQELKKLPTVNWDDIKTVEEVEQAEGASHLRLELKNAIEQHFRICGMTVDNGGKDKGRTAAVKSRQPRRSKDQVIYDQAVNEARKEAREKLKLPDRGKLREEDKSRLEAEVEKILHKKKIVAPKG